MFYDEDQVHRKVYCHGVGLTTKECHSGRLIPLAPCSRGWRERRESGSMGIVPQAERQSGLPCQESCPPAQYRFRRSERALVEQKYTIVHSESFQTPSLFTHFVLLQPYSNMDKIHFDPHHTP